MYFIQKELQTHPHTGNRRKKGTRGKWHHVKTNYVLVSTFVKGEMHEISILAEMHEILAETFQ